MRHHLKRNRKNNSSNTGQNRGKSNTIKNPSRTQFLCNLPTGKIHGNAQHIIDRCTEMAREARMNGDESLSEVLLQGAEHYLRLIMSYNKWEEENREAKQNRNENTHGNNQADNQADKNSDEDNQSDVDSVDMEDDKPSMEIKERPKRKVTKPRKSVLRVKSTKKLESENAQSKETKGKTQADLNTDTDTIDKVS